MIITEPDDQEVFTDMSVLPLVFPDNMSCFSRGSYKVILMIKIMIMMMFKMIVLMLVIILTTV